MIRFLGTCSFLGEVGRVDPVECSSLGGWNALLAGGFRKMFGVDYGKGKGGFLIVGSLLILASGGAGVLQNAFLIRL